MRLIAFAAVLHYSWGFNALSLHTHPIRSLSRFTSSSPLNDWNDGDSEYWYDDRDDIASDEAVSAVLWGDSSQLNHEGYFDEPEEEEDLEALIAAFQEEFPLGDENESDDATTRKRWEEFLAKAEQLKSKLGRSKRVAARQPSQETPVRKSRVTGAGSVKMDRSYAERESSDGAETEDDDYALSILDENDDQLYTPFLTSTSESNSQQLQEQNELKSLQAASSSLSPTTTTISTAAPTATSTIATSTSTIVTSRKRTWASSSSSLSSPSLSSSSATAAATVATTVAVAQQRQVSVGIDLGTTNSLVALWVDGRPTLCPNDEGSHLTPSVVAFLNPEEGDDDEEDDDGDDDNNGLSKFSVVSPWESSALTSLEASGDIALRDDWGRGTVVLVGAAAKQQALWNPCNTFSSVKRVIGRQTDLLTDVMSTAPGKEETRTPVLPSTSPQQSYFSPNSQQQETETRPSSQYRPQQRSQKLEGMEERRRLGAMVESETTESGETLLHVPALGPFSSNSQPLDNSRALRISPIDISAEVLRSLLRDADRFIATNRKTMLKSSNISSSSSGSSVSGNTSSSGGIKEVAIKASPKVEATMATAAAEAVAAAGEVAENLVGWLTGGGLRPPSLPNAKTELTAAAITTAELSKTVVSDEEITITTGRSGLDDSLLQESLQVSCAVVGVPAHFNDAQREATATACILAGLEEVVLITEPEAAALAFGLGRRRSGRSAEAMARAEADLTSVERALVVDVGGGTFDVSVVDVHCDRVETVALGGDSRLGGDDFDDALAQWFEESFFDQQQTQTQQQQSKTAGRSRSSSGSSSSSIERQKKKNKRGKTAGETRAGVGVLRSGVERWRLLDAAEECRVALSSDTEATVFVPDLDSTGSGLGPMVVTRKQFERVCEPLLGRLRVALADVLRASATASSSNSPSGAPTTAAATAVLANVVLVGGAVRMPCIARIVKQEVVAFLTREAAAASKKTQGRDQAPEIIAPPQMRRTVNPDEAIALGCAIQAAHLDGLVSDLRLVNRAPPPKATTRKAA